MTTQSKRVEAVFYRHFVVYRYEMDSVEDAISFLNYGEDDGSLATVGVFVNGEPSLVDTYAPDEPRKPTTEEAEQMRKDYAEAVEY